jgi:hypothetical protein
MRLAVPRILGQTSVSPQPREAAFNDPSARMDLEADLSRELADDLDGDARRVSHAFCGIGSVCEGKLAGSFASTPERCMRP